MCSIRITRAAANSVNMDDEDGGLLSIDIDISEDDGETLEKKEARRTGQTEEAFQAVRRDYEIKVENGDVSRNPLVESLQS